MRVVPIASPSRPSVRFTALLDEGEQQHREDDVEEAEVGHDLLEEREDDAGRVLARLDLGEQVDGDAHREPDRELAQELHAAR